MMKKKSENTQIIKNRYAIVITSINYPTKAILEIAKNAQSQSFDFIVVGDLKSKSDFQVNSCRFYSLDAQLKSDFIFAHKCPTGHYARKNIGYLIAISRNCDFIVETDDDNIPIEDFWKPRELELSTFQITQKGWINVYKYFSDSLVWPRGLPLNAIHKEVIPLSSIPVRDVICPIQQGLANGNPDVDAIYRLVFPSQFNFNNNVQVALGDGVWCPFNSQNTTWFPHAYPLLYLPAYCSFRMTDIWRSFVAQCIAWANGWSILFHKPTVYQQRNEHNLIRDFEDEVVGYLNNEKICETLSNLKLQPGLENIPDNMIICYEQLIKLGVISVNEIELLKTWLHDLSQFQNLV